jgi:5'-nucleotidase
VKILVSNDDGIHSEGLWVLARELSKIAEVVIVAPDREQSAVGTAVSLRKPLRVQKIVPLEPGIEAYSVEGTPSDSVIVGLGKLVPGKIDLVISGINQGSNLGEDVLISGTVGAALAAYLRGFPAIAVSCGIECWNLPFIQDTARFTSLLSRRLGSLDLPGNILLNVNMPSIPLAEVKGVKITSLAHKSHINTVEEGHDGRRAYYMLMRESVNHQVDPRTDIRSTLKGNISITPLHLFLNDRLPVTLLEQLTKDILEELKTYSRPQPARKP